MIGFDDEVTRLRQAVAEGIGSVSLDAVRAVAAVEAAAVRDLVAPHEVASMRRDNADVFATIDHHLDSVVGSVLDRIDHVDAYDWPGVCAVRSGIERLMAWAAGAGPVTDVRRRALASLDAELRHAGVAFGPVQDAWRPAGIPPHHWWWWHPAAPAPALVAEHARLLTDARIACTPAGSSVHAMLQSIRAQLVFLEDAFATRATLAISEVNRLTIGVIAVREFEDTDPEYCDVLTHVASLARARA